MTINIDVNEHPYTPKYCPQRTIFFEAVTMIRLCSHACQMLVRNTSQKYCNTRLLFLWDCRPTNTTATFRTFNSLTHWTLCTKRHHKCICSFIVPCTDFPNSHNLTELRTYYSSRNRHDGSNTITFDHDDNDDADKTLSALFIPVKIPIKTKAFEEDINVGEELGGTLKHRKDEITQQLEEFGKRKTIRMLAEEYGLDDNLFNQSYQSFQNYIIKSKTLEPELHIVLSDILSGSGHIDDIFPYFIKHAHQVFPALNCMEDLKKISDLTEPAQWYREARAIKRKIIVHAGPTNSGKTYHALERFCKAKSGVYCGPLKLLASEVHGKTNERGIPCDMVTGEERRFASPDGLPSNHVACTVEMTNVAVPYEVAIIDEIQMLRDPARGWAWTRALLGLAAEEVHLCGEASAIDMVKQLALSTGDEVEVRQYERLTPLEIQDKPLESLQNVKPGDCIVAFSKKDLYQISRDLEAMGKECAVIYGSLPPGTKMAQASMFNDPKHSCKILVATDAIGMGLNLSIKRVIFYSLTRPSVNEKGEMHMELLSTSQALQIAGRAGRYGTEFAEGEATTFHAADLPVLKTILAKTVDPILMAGLHPTAEQIELFAYQLVDASLSNLIDIFIKLSQLETNYFVCNMTDFKALANMLEHIPLHLRARYIFCCAPLDKKNMFVCTMFVKFARQYSRNAPMSFSWFCSQIGWPPYVPKNIKDLVHLEAVHDVMDLYLWLSYRFMDMFPDAELVRDIQRQLDTTFIQQGVANITKLIQATQAGKAIGSAVAVETKKADSDDEADHQVFDKMSKTKPPARAGNTTAPGLLRASEKLIQMGVLSQEQLKELQSEFARTSRHQKRNKKKK